MLFDPQTQSKPSKLSIFYQANKVALIVPLPKMLPLKKNETNKSGKQISFFLNTHLADDN